MHLLLTGQVVINDDGLPEVRSEALAIVIQDLNRSIGCEEGA
jgi:hypothetical protein